MLTGGIKKVANSLKMTFRILKMLDDGFWQMVIVLKKTTTKQQTSPTLAEEIMAPRVGTQRGETADIPGKRKDITPPQRGGQTA